MFYKKICFFWARWRPANKQQAKDEAEWRLILTLRALLAWKSVRQIFNTDQPFLDLIYMIICKFFIIYFYILYTLPRKNMNLP